jgi:predicted ATP-dependent endonuclease of OLD family
LDNPGLELHSDGQRDIKRFLEEKLSPTTQVIYVTHSPAMIDTYNLEQVRCVELRGDMQGTRVSKLTFEGDEVDLLEPVRSAIGASLVDTLMTNDYNVLVEGAADKPILEAAFASYGAKEGKKVMINGSISESGLLLPNFYKKMGLPYAIFLDADSGGRDLGKKLQSAGISADKIVNLSDVSKKDKDHELEDLFSYQVYYAAVRDTYPNLTIQEVVSTEGKRTRLYAEAFKQNHRIGFNKRRVGETLKRHLGENKADEETAMNLKIVVESIWKTLQAQVKA